MKKFICFLCSLLTGCGTFGPPSLCVKKRMLVITMYEDSHKKPPCGALEKAKKVIKIVKEK